MPAYQSTPFTSVRGLVPGQPAYSAGSRNLGISGARAYVTQIAVATNVVTLTVAIVEGNIPAVGDLVTVRGTPIAAANVSNVALTGVSINANAGIGTFTYAATTPDQSAIPSGGQARCAVPEVAEALVAQAYQQFAVDGNAVTWAYTCPSQPASISIQLEGAINDNDAEYTAIGSPLTAVAGYNETIATVPSLVNFVRVKVTATAGGSSPTLIAKLLNSAPQRPKA